MALLRMRRESRDIGEQLRARFGHVIEARCHPRRAVRKHLLHIAVEAEHTRLHTGRKPETDVEVPVVPAGYAPRPPCAVRVAHEEPLELVKGRVVPHIDLKPVVVHVFDRGRNDPGEPLRRFGAVRPLPEIHRHVFGQQEARPLPVVDRARLAEFDCHVGHLVLLRPVGGPLLAFLQWNEVQIEIRARNVPERTVAVSEGQAGRVLPLQQLQRQLYHRCDLRGAELRRIAHAVRVDIRAGGHDVHRRNPRDDRRVIPVAFQPELHLPLIFAAHRFA